MFEISTEGIQEAILANQPTAIESVNDESTDEMLLNVQINELWQTHETYKSILKQELRTFRSLRAELGERFFAMKQLLARPGRGGQWSSWLKERRIPRATADRLVKKHEQKLHPVNNCLSEQLTEPTEEDVQKLLGAILPKLRKVLRTPSSMDRFVQLLVKSFADTEDSEMVRSSESGS
jgi:hypothetical protein